MGGGALVSCSPPVVVYPLVPFWILCGTGGAGSVAPMHPSRTAYDASCLWSTPFVRAWCSWKIICTCLVPGNLVAQVHVAVVSHGEKG